MVVSRFDIFLVNLDPTIGSEIKKTRPCMIISPDEINRSISTVIVAPLTSKGNLYPSRVKCHYEGKDGLILLDQIRCIDKRRLVKKLNPIDERTTIKTMDVLQKIFAW